MYFIWARPGDYCTAPLFRGCRLGQWRVTSLWDVAQPIYRPFLSTSLLTDKHSASSRKRQIREHEPNKSERKSSSRVRVRYPSDRLKGSSRSHGFRALGSCQFDPLRGRYGPGLVQHPSLLHPLWVVRRSRPGSDIHMMDLRTL